MEPLVKIEGIRKIYHQGTVEVPALQGIDLEIRRGDFLLGEPIQRLPLQGSMRGLEVRPKPQ